jgi:nucleotide-binding universal stress UspA family protein
LIEIKTSDEGRPYRRVAGPPPRHPENVMSYATLMVCLQAGPSHEPLLGIVETLATRFCAAVVGIGACQLTALSYGEGYATSETHEALRQDLLRNLKSAETEFRRVLGGRGQSIEWRDCITEDPIVRYLVAEARAADLVIMSADRTGAFVDGLRRVDIANAVMSLGRPALVVPDTVTSLSLDLMMIGWKDTPETRRAVANAVPLLRQAGRVMVVEIASSRMLAAAAARVQDVVSWLRRHGVTAEGSVQAATGNDSMQLEALMFEHGAGVMVAGAYGHSRLRETILGGVTHHLLTQSRRCSLLTH